MPGLGKTLLVRTLAECVDLSYSRIQFTPDLMPADIVGTDVIIESDGGRQLRLPARADLRPPDPGRRDQPRHARAPSRPCWRRCRSTPSPWAADTHPLPQPFFVLATQNPIDLQGTYPLPEAQLDRFFFKLIVSYPQHGGAEGDRPAHHRQRTVRAPRLVMDGPDAASSCRQLVREVPIAEPVLDYAARLVMATHPDERGAATARRFVRYGASPRAIQTLDPGGQDQRPALRPLQRRL